MSILPYLALTQLMDYLYRCGWNGIVAMFHRPEQLGYVAQLRDLIQVHLLGTKEGYDRRGDGFQHLTLGRQKKKDL